MQLPLKEKLKAKHFKVDDRIKKIILDLLKKCAQSNWEYALPDESSFLTLAFYNLSLYPEQDDSSSEIVFGTTNYKLDSKGKPQRFNTKNKPEKLNCKTNGKDIEVIYKEDDLVNEILLQNIRFKLKNQTAEDVSHFSTQQPNSYIQEEYVWEFEKALDDKLPDSLKPNPNDNDWYPFISPKEVVKYET